MDIQKMIDNAMEAGRAKEMLTSDQLTLGELRLKLEAVTDKDLPIVLDSGKHKPTGLASWRGSYQELAIQYEDGGSSCYEQPKPDCKMDDFGDHHYDCPCGGSKGHSTTLSKKPTVKEFIKVLELVNKKYFVGYKGGDFTMGKTTPLWISNYGNSSGYKSDDDNGKYNQGVMEVKELKTKVSIVTKAI